MGIGRSALVTNAAILRDKFELVSQVRLKKESGGVHQSMSLGRRGPERRWMAEALQSEVMMPSRGRDVTLSHDLSFLD